MNRVLVIAPQAWGDDALDAVLASAQKVLGEGEFAALLLGAQKAPSGWARAASAGTNEVWEALHPELEAREDPLALSFAAAEALNALPGLADATTLVLLPSGPQGEELAARLADRLGGRALGRCTDIRVDAAGILATRAGWGGRMRVGLRVDTGLAFACLRSGRPRLRDGAEPVPGMLALSVPLPEPLALDLVPGSQRLPPLEGAKLVVSGGRGVDEQGFALLEQVALALGGTLGGSLPAVDAGMVPVMRQVGVSGKFVAPDIYLAVGISGTPQHLAGISADSRIVAMNKDPEADIFKVASLGIVGQWQELLPALIEELQTEAD